MAAQKCPKCGSEMVLRTRRSDGAKFFGCSRYKDGCRGTRKYVPPAVTEESCLADEVRCFGCELHCTDDCFLVMAFEGR